MYPVYSFEYKPEGNDEGWPLGSEVCLLKPGRSLAPEPACACPKASPSTLPNKKKVKCHVFKRRFFELSLKLIGKEISSGFWYVKTLIYWIWENILF